MHDAMMQKHTARNIAAKGSRKQTRKESRKDKQKIKRRRRVKLHEKFFLQKQKLQNEQQN